MVPRPRSALDRLLRTVLVPALIACLASLAAIAGPQLIESAVQLASEFPGLEINPLEADYSEISEIPGTKRTPKRTVAFFPGSTIGNFDPAEVIALLARTGFDGFLLDDHVPKMDGDSDWNHRGRSHAIGYMQGLIRMYEFMSKA